MLPVSSRYVVIMTHTEWYTSDVSQRLCDEVRVCNLLRHRDVNVVPFLGVYSTEAHPFVLIYEYMDGLDLKQYLRNETNDRRLKLVLVPLRPLLILGTNPMIFLDNSWLILLRV